MIDFPSRGLFLRLVHPAPPAGTVAVEPGALDAAAAMAVEHNLFMLLYGRVRSLRERMEPAGEADGFLERHSQLYYTGIARIAKQAAEAAEMAGLLADGGLPFVEFRGGQIAREIFGDPHSRISNDVDLLVREDDVERVDGLLGSAGFARKDPLPLKYWLGRMHHAAYGRPGSAFPAEVHWHFGIPSFFRLTNGEIWEEVIRDEVIGDESGRYRLSPKMYLVMLFMHHHLHSLVEMRPLVDLLWGMEKMKEEVDWSSFVEDAGRIGLVKTVGIALGQLRLLWGESAIAGGVEPVRLLEEGLRGVRPAVSRRLRERFTIDVAGKRRSMRAADRLSVRLALDRWSTIVGSYVKVLFPAPAALEALYGRRSPLLRPLLYLRFILWRAGRGAAG